MNEQRGVKTLTSALAHDSDLVAVLRGHLFVEAQLANLIAALFPGALALVEELGYADKYRTAKRRMLISRDDARVLEALGHLRDSFAHLPIKTRITEADARQFYDAFAEPMRARIDAAEPLGPNEAERAPGRLVRAAISVLYERLIDLGRRPAAVANNDNRGEEP